MVVILELDSRLKVYSLSQVVLVAVQEYPVDVGIELKYRPVFVLGYFLGDCLQIHRIVDYLMIIRYTLS